MKRSPVTGKFVLSAGEVGAYTVCPEAWRLRMIERVDSIQTETSEQGQKLHQEWAKEIDESVFLARRVRQLLLLIVLAVVVYILAKVVA